MTNDLLGVAPYGHGVAVAFADRLRWAALFLPSDAPTEQLPDDDSFRPLAHDPRSSALFREMADAEPTTAGMQAFVDRFHPLPPRGRVLLINAVYGWIDDRMDDCEFLLAPGDELRKEILAIRRCVALWEMRCERPYDRLMRHVRRQVDADGALSVKYDSHPDLAPGEPAPGPDERVEEVFLSEAEHPEILRQRDMNSPATLAVVYLKGVIARHLQGRVAPRLMGHRGQKTVMRLCAAPTSVPAALWLQFADAVAERRSYTRCEECRAWYEASSHGRARTERQYCSDRCRTNAYRRRVDTARRLYGEGKKPKEIAQELNSDLETVKGWISPKGKDA